jgi:hypothetical protein
MVRHQTVGPHRNGQNRVNEGFSTISKLSIYPIVPCTENTFFNRESEPANSLILHSDHCTISLYPIAVSKLLLKPEDFQPRACMSDKFSASENVVKEVLIDLVTKRVMLMFVGIQASSTRMVQASSSTARGVEPSRPSVEKRTKHKDDLANEKLIPTIFPDYIPPLASVVNRDSVPRYFEYTIVIAYLPKGICAIRVDQDKIAALKFSDFNLIDRKIYGMLTPYKYLTRTKGKNSKIIPQLWTMNLVQSTLLNGMKIPHFGRHQEVNAYVKLLLLCYHGGYLWIYHRITVDPTLIHGITGLTMQGPNPQDFYPRKSATRAFVQKIKDTYGDIEKGTRGYKVASIQSGAVCLACQLIDGKLVRKNRPMQVIGFIIDIAGKCVEGL